MQLIVVVVVVVVVRVYDCVTSFNSNGFNVMYEKLKSKEIKRACMFVYAYTCAWEHQKLLHIL
jgi:hypothetical protein